MSKETKLRWLIFAGVVLVGFLSAYFIQQGGWPR
jgi:hypothetical protein